MENIEEEDTKVVIVKEVVKLAFCELIGDSNFLMNNANGMGEYEEDEVLFQ
jgi:hypothetical protein